MAYSSHFSGYKCVLLGLSVLTCKMGQGLKNSIAKSSFLLRLYESGTVLSILPFHGLLGPEGCSAPNPAFPLLAGTGLWLPPKLCPPVPPLPKAFGEHLSLLSCFLV